MPEIIGTAINVDDVVVQEADTAEDADASIRIGMEHLDLHLHVQT